MTATLRFERRFRGPESSANGGYAAGALARHAGGEAEVTLRLPPPLERDLAVERREGSVVLLDGDAVVAEAVPTEVEPDDLPVAVTFEEAQEAAARSVPFGAETFRGCFSCGVLRHSPDGLCIFPGRVREGVVAAPWVAHDVSAEVVWAAIDCSGAYAVGAEGRGECVLGRMAARVERLPREGERCVVMGWRRGEDGRKLYAGTALWGEDGALLAHARQTWIVPRTHAA